MIDGRPATWGESIIFWTPLMLIEAAAGLLVWWLLG